MFLSQSRALEFLRGDAVALQRGQGRQLWWGQKTGGLIQDALVALGHLLQIFVDFLL